MITEGILSRLDAVRRSGDGWLARCPAHEDRNPSLSIREGEKGLLLRCWAGCGLEAILAGIGIVVKDLFYDASPHERRRAAGAPKSRRYDFRKAAAEYQDHAVGLRLRGESVLAAAQGHDISEWSDEQVDRALRAVCKARTDMERADVLDHIAFSIRARGLAKENDRASKRAA